MTLFYNEERFAVLSISREGIADILNNEADDELKFAPFSPDDERLTTELCRALVVKLGELYSRFLSQQVFSQELGEILRTFIKMYG